MLQFIAEQTDFFLHPGIILQQFDDFLLPHAGEVRVVYHLFDPPFSENIRCYAVREMAL